MRHIWSIAAKELRGYFNSAVALIFLTTFLAVVLFTFFFVDKFFARNIADVRPLFDWLPLLLIFLVAALTMRLWSEEQKTGTLEILLTLPVPLHRLVLGKFLAGLILVAIALMLTLGVPLTVSHIGPLDWGPVIGGYLAALLLASTYLAVGLCISSVTENQIVALIGTVLVGVLLYLPGVDAVTTYVGTDSAHALRLLGTGSRFESIARGVLDLRDLAYYGGLVALFLTLNTVLLAAKRWGNGAHTVAVRRNMLLAVALTALNVVALNIWLAPVHAARVDLTRGGMYSLSDSTEEILASLDEPLIIRGYFSGKTHPLLMPLVPQIRDLLDEYAAVGGSKVRVSFVDPSTDEAIEKEAQEQYNIKSMPFRFEDRFEQSVVNSYFHILVAYGDQYEVLQVDALIDVQVAGAGDVDVRLGNLEYEITKAIRKTALGFQSVDSLFASMPGTVELEAYITPGSLPETWKDVPERLETVAKELGDKSGGKFVYKMIEPDQAMAAELAQRYGFQPYAVFGASEPFFLHLLLRSGDRLAQIVPPEDPTPAALRETITSTIKRVTPGFMRVVGIAAPPPGPPAQANPNMPPQPTPPAQSFNALRDTLRETYEVRMVDLNSGEVDDAIDVLIVAGPDQMGGIEQKALDQFLMRGGAVIVLAGRHRLDAKARELSIETVQTGLESLLEKYGVKLGDKMVLDSENDSFPIPVMRNLGGLRVREVQQLPYPFFVKIPRAGMGQGGIVTSGLGPVIMHWSQPVTLVDRKAAADGDQAGAATDGDAKPDAKIDARVLLSSSKDSWLQAGVAVQPDFNRYPETGFGKPTTLAEGEAGPHSLAVMLTGSFDSALADEPADDAGDDEAPERLIKRSTPDARLVVIGSSSFVSDTVLGIAQQAGSREVANNLQLIQNLVDWSLEDTALLSIRARTSAATLDIPDKERSKWAYLNFLFALMGLAAVIGASWVVRKQTMDLGGALAAARRGNDKGGNDKSKEAA